MLFNLNLKKFILFLFIVFIVGCGKNMDKAEGVFKEFIANPIPETVTILEGKRNTMMEFSANVTFTTDGDTFNTFLKGYTQIQIETAFINADSWLPNDLRDKPKGFICFGRKEKKGDKKQEYYLFWNQELGKAYFLTMVY